MKSVSVQWTRDVSLDEARIALEGIAEAFEDIIRIAANHGFDLGRPEMRPFGTWRIPGVETGSPYWSTRWYVTESLNRATGKIKGERFIDVIREEPWQKMGAHYDVALIHFDLDADQEKLSIVDGNSFALSTTEANLAAVISVLRLRELADNDEFALSLRRLAAHSVGHVIEATAPRRPTVERSFGELHCTNLCIMRHASTVTEILRFAQEEEESDVLFCDECRSDILDHGIRNHFGAN